MAVAFAKLAKVDGQPDVFANNNPHLGARRGGYPQPAGSQPQARCQAQGGVDDAQQLRVARQRRVAEGAELATSMMPAPSRCCSLTG
jgi:hypothetical protein